MIYKLYLKYFFNDKKLVFSYLGVFAIVVAITMFFWTSLSLNSINMVDSFYDLYGKNAIRIDDFNECKEYTSFSNEECVESLCWLNFYTFEKNNEKYEYYMGEDNLLQYTNFELLVGKFPEKENEVAVEKSYLFEKGLKEKEMLASEIELPSPDGNKIKKYKVSGILQFHSAMLENEKNIKVVMFQESSRCKSIFVELRNYDQYKKDIDYLIKKYKLDKKKCFVNFNLFLELGILDEQNIVEENNTAFLYLFFFILLCAMIIIYNISKLHFVSIKNDMRIFHLLGSKSSNLYFAYFLFMIIMLMLGLFLGVILASLAFFIVIKLFYSAINLHFVLENVKYDMILICGLSILLASFITVIALIIKNKFEIKKLKKKASKDIFLLNKNISWKFSLAVNEIRQKKLHTIIHGFAISICIVVFTIGFYVIQINKQSAGYITDFDYKIEFYNGGTISDEEEENRCKFYNDLVRDKDNYMVYPEYNQLASYSVKKSIFTEEYKKNLSYDINQDISFGEDVNLQILVLGYNSSLVKELEKLNNKDVSLNNDEAIILNKAVSLVEEEGVQVFKEKPKEIAVTSNITSKNYRFKVREYVDSLPSYPDNNYNRICVIVNENVYKKMMEEKYPEIIYVNINEMASSSALDFLLGRSMYQITVPADKKNEIEIASRNARNIIILIFSIFTIVVMVAIYTSFAVDMKVKLKDIIMYKSIGISDENIFHVYMIESLFVIIVSVVIAFFVSYIGAYFAHNIIFKEMGVILYSFPYKPFIISIVAVLLLIAFCLFALYNKVKKINIVGELKKDHNL